MLDQITSATATKSNGLGLQVDGTGFRKDGKAFRGIGVNHFSLFLNSIMDMGIGGISTTQPDIDLLTIKQTYGLPFVRFSVGGFSRASWLQWHNNKAAYYSALDSIVASAERYGIGLIPVLFWDLRSFTDATFTVFGTTDGPVKIADKKSNSWNLLTQFVGDIVARYKNSPAIWGWSIGNEIISKCGPEYNSAWSVDGSKAAWLNWGTKPDGANYAASDKMTMVNWTEFSRNIIEYIRSIDSSGRAIFPGNAIGNSFAVSAQSADTFTADTLAQWNSSSFGMPWLQARDQSYSTLTQHIYPQSLVNGMFFNGAEKTHSEIIALSKGWADQCGKPLFLEEWGATFHGDSVDQTSVDLATETANFNAALSAIQSNNIQLSALWNYGGDLAGGSAWQLWKLTDSSRLYQLNAIATANAAMQN